MLLDGACNESLACQVCLTSNGKTVLQCDNAKTYKNVEVTSGKTTSILFQCYLTVRVKKVWRVCGFATKQCRFTQQCMKQRYKPHCVLQKQVNCDNFNRQFFSGKPSSACFFLQTVVKLNYKFWEVYYDRM